MSYFNAASHGLPNPDVYEAMADFLDGQATTVAGGSLKENGYVLDAKAAVASVLTARVDRLGFTSTTTAAWHTVVGSLDLAEKRVLVAEHEWGDF